MKLPLSHSLSLKSPCWVGSNCRWRLSPSPPVCGHLCEYLFDPCGLEDVGTVGPLWSDLTVVLLGLPACSDQTMPGRRSLSESFQQQQYCNLPFFSYPSVYGQSGWSLYLVLWSLVSCIAITWWMGSNPELLNCFGVGSSSSDLLGFCPCVNQSSIPRVSQATLPPGSYQSSSHCRNCCCLPFHVLCPSSASVSASLIRQCLACDGGCPGWCCWFVLLTLPEGRSPAVNIPLYNETHPHLKKWL